MARSRRRPDAGDWPVMQVAGEGPAMRLLIVDDDLAVRRLVSSRLEQQGVSVRSAATKAAAFAELQHNVFDVAILDLKLPDGSGLDVLRTLRERESPTHVIILSAAG